MLREMRLLLLEEGHCFRDQAMNFCKMGSPNTQDIMDGNSLTTLSKWLRWFWCDPDPRDGS